MQEAFCFRIKSISLDRMGRKYTITDSSKIYFVSFATVNWIDVFVRRMYCDILVDSLKYCIENKGLEIYAWSIMSSHVHLIISTEQDNLSDIMRDMKRHTSKQLLKAIDDNIQESRREWMLWMFGRAGKRNTNNEKYQFWQQNNHPIELSTNEMIDQRLHYLNNNPVEAGMVANAEDYLYSSAIDYSGGKGFVSVVLVS
jgi:putative transposase